jgi:nucleoside-diphosphate-sugar epimerase
MSIHTALITGGTGFVGSNLAKRLVRDGWKVHITTIPNDNLSQIQEIIDQVTLHVHDGSSAGMLEIVARVKPLVVFHLASLFLSEHTVDQVEPLVRCNILFGTQLLEAMAANGVHLLVNTGTSWEHYENKPYSPVNLYASTKQAFESILQYYVEAKGFQAVTLKLFDTYGQVDPRPKLFTLLRRVASEQNTLAMSPGEQMIDLVHVDDVVEAFSLSAQRLVNDTVKGHERYSVSSGQPIRLRDLVELYGHVTGSTLPIEWGGRPYRDREVMVPWNSGTPVPGWRPGVGLEEGIRQMENMTHGHLK